MGVRGGRDGGGGGGCGGECVVCAREGRKERRTTPMARWQQQQQWLLLRQAAGAGAAAGGTAASGTTDGGTGNLGNTQQQRRCSGWRHGHTAHVVTSLWIAGRWPAATAQPQIGGLLTVRRFGPAAGASRSCSRQRLPGGKQAQRGVPSAAATARRQLMRFVPAVATPGVLPPLPPRLVFKNRSSSNRGLEQVCTAP